MISEWARVFDDVEIGHGSDVEDFCVLGVRTPRMTGRVVTLIGPEAMIRSHTVIYAGNVIGARFQTGNRVNVRELNRIGDDVSIGTSTVVEHSVVIGHRVRIHSQAFVPEFTVLEDDCWIGPNVVLTNARYPNAPGVKDELRGPTICRRAMIGANCTILPGVRIGEGSLIGAGSVVTKDVPPGVVAAGVPAAVLREIHY